MRAILSLVLVLAGVACAAPAAFARSLEIEHLHAEIVIGEDATLQIVERIDVRFRGSWNGIFRKIPYGYLYPSGVRGTIALQVTSVEDRAGNGLWYEETRSDGVVQLKIRVPGASDAVRRVVIRYRVRNALRQYDEADSSFGVQDQLYWNLIGPGWEIPVTKASCAIYLPASLGALETSAFRTATYRGPYASGMQAAPLVRDEDGVFRFETARPLGPYRAATVVLGFPPGHIEYPGRLQRFWWFLQANWFLLIPFLLLALWIFFWWRHGRDHLGDRTIIPEFEAPFGLRPAEVGVLMDDTLDQHDVMAAIVDLAVRRVLTIHDDSPDGKKGERSLVLHREKMEDAELSKFDRKLIDGLFGDEDDEVSLDSLKYKFHKNLPGIRKAVLNHLVQRKFFPKSPEKVAGKWAGYTILVLIGCVVLGIVFHFNILYWLALIACGVGMFIAAAYMPKRTKRGLDALARIRGMEEYMVTAEKQRMKDLPMETFERLLPYAITFGIHDRWVSAFAEIFDQQPDWYVTPHGAWSAVYLSHGLSSLGRDVRGNLYAARRSTRSGTSGGWSGGGWSGGSGFSGGSSGGGFGGGGGGGW